jgi:hypothetical protein
MAELEHGPAMGASPEYGPAMGAILLGRRRRQFQTGRWNFKRGGAGNFKQGGGIPNRAERFQFLAVASGGCITQMGSSDRIQ